MQIGFEVTAAVPKRLRAVEEQPAQQPMRGERKITQAPSTDQKKVRRAMQRKTATTCSCATHDDGSVTKMLCPAHAPEDPCATMAAVTGERRRGSVVRGVCSACGWSAKGSDSKTAASEVGHTDTDTGEVMHKGRWGDLRPGDRMVGLDGAIVTHVGPSDRMVNGVRLVHVKTVHPHRGEQSHHEYPFSPQGASPEDNESAKLTFYRQSSKTAAYSAGDCRMCGGNLIPMGQHPDSPSTLRAQCTDCGTKHDLQGAEVKKVSAADMERLQNLSSAERERLEALAGWKELLLGPEPPAYMKASCPHCGAGSSRQEREGLTGRGVALRCRKCKKSHDVAFQRSDDPWGSSAASRTAALVAVMDAHWEPIVDTSPYLSAPGMSAIARRAHSVLDTKENS